MTKEIGPEMTKNHKICRRKRLKKLKTIQGIFDHLVEGDDDSDFAKLFRSGVRPDRNPIPSRTMTLIESRRKYPDVPHRWLCNGKLLVLEDPKHSKNIELFQVIF